MKCGIYQILNVLDGKSYIGSSYNIEGRWYEHKRRLNLGNHANKYLQNVWNKHKEDFVFEIIEECALEELEKKEIYYIGFYKTFYKDGNGYNLTIGGDGIPGGGEKHPRYGKTPWNKGIPFAEEAKLKMRISKSNNPKTPNASNKIKQKDLDNNVLKEYISVGDASKLVGISKTSIFNCLGGLTNTAGGYKWEYVKK